ncbi:EamA family transporter RarD [Amnibacterium kyonggiense]|uniref:Chloramphenicol-sensitive protein RarD n=1 Tax=Amnibacterium kyonggiense TaxID=595671 RepID=A0A4R7FR28_9MICO|nr:EamA family transporter RarD [Amnibacterium kyonggiense]TDS80176.1 chloramphenicol-sensitive protein RarD [Amnibacterium kyonggiense]
MTSEARASTRAGLLFGIGAYALWGAMPVYFLLMRPAGPFEIVAWRILFSLVFCALLLLVTRGFGRFRSVLHDRRAVASFALAGALIWANWTVYVIASTSGRVVDAALGYFINPIVTVLLGVVVQKERLRTLQWVAIGVSVLAVVVLAIETGSLPWISLALAASFGLYGLVKKRAGRIDAVSGLTLETAWLVPVAVVQLVVVGSTSGLAWGSAGWFPTLMLTSAGVGTAVPLLLFASSTRRLPLSVVGFLQYIAPILQLAIGVAVLHEPMSTGRWTGFVLVWVALVVLVGESLVRGRSRGIARVEPDPVA